MCFHAVQCVLHICVSPVDKKLSLSIVIAITCDAFDAFLWAIQIDNDSWFIAVPSHVLPILVVVAVLGESAGALYAKFGS